MFILSFFRVIKFSFQDVARNIWLSVITVLIIALALFSVNLLIAVKVLTSAAVGAVREKIDISLYLKSDTDENLIIDLKNEIAGFDSVKNVGYVSKQDAIEKFKKSHKNDPEILQALLELGKNPLSPNLIIKPKNPDNCDELAASLNKMENNIIESKNFDDHKAILAKINNISGKVGQAGLFVSCLFVFITILVVYNAVRVAIFTHKKEIGIMKLVGASNWFIRAPYIFSGMIYAFFGVAMVIMAIYPFLSMAQPYIGTFFSGFEVNLLDYFKNNFFFIFGLEFLIASLVNIFASLIAVGKYSKV